MTQFIPTYFHPASVNNVTEPSKVTLLVIFTILAVAFMQTGRKVFPDIVNLFLGLAGALAKVCAPLAAWYFRIAGAKFPGFAGPPNMGYRRSYADAMLYLKYDYETWRWSLPLYMLAEPFNPTADDVYLYMGRRRATVSTKSPFRMCRPSRGAGRKFNARVPSRLAVVTSINDLDGS